MGKYANRRKKNFEIGKNLKRKGTLQRWDSLRDMHGFTFEIFKKEFFWWMR